MSSRYAKEVDTFTATRGNTLQHAATHCKHTANTLQTRTQTNTQTRTQTCVGRVRWAHVRRGSGHLQTQHLARYVPTLYVNTYIHMFINMHVCIDGYILIYGYMCMIIHVHTHICMYIHMCVPIYTPSKTQHLATYIYPRCVYIHMCIYIYVYLQMCE